MFPWLRTAVIAGLFLLLPAATEPPQQISPREIRSHVEFLGHTLLEGRLTGTRGHDIAARYVATQFDAFALQPGAGPSWYQDVPLVEYRLNPRTAHLRIGGQQFKHGPDVIIWQNPAEGVLELHKPVVFVGFGIDEPAVRLNDYEGLNVTGKVVAILAGTPPGMSGDVAAHLAEQRLQTAQKHGATGVLFVRTPADAKVAPWNKLQESAHAPGLTWRDRQGVAHADAPGIRFVATLNDRAAAALFAGSGRSLSQVFAEAKAGSSVTGYALNKVITVKRESRNKRLTSRNVLAVLPGSDPAVADEYVLVTAHLDGMGIRADGQARPGAVDNAAGVSAMLQTARALAELEVPPRRPILFAALTGEEQGLLGSGYLAANPIAPGRIVATVNVDMPILLYNFHDVIAFGAEHSTLGFVAKAAAERMGLRVAADPLPEYGLFTRSDHYSFVRAGVPAVFLMTGFANGGREKFMSFLSGPYHQPGDNLSQPFNWEAGARFAELNLTIVRDIANACAPPRWHNNSFFRPKN